MICATMLTLSPPICFEKSSPCIPALVCYKLRLQNKRGGEFLDRVSTKSSSSPPERPHRAAFQISESMSVHSKRDIRVMTWGTSLQLHHSFANLNCTAFNIMEKQNGFHHCGYHVIFQAHQREYHLIFIDKAC